ncbi:MAG: substrate binding domain-containing protein, partial [Alphaproteobacteria bacterium]|nr:substrate binding domain-containing protein [Alphaproteobacteria bacterium]
ASPAYLAEHGHPTHPAHLSAHHCMGYAYRSRRDVWRFTNAEGREITVAPSGPLSVTNVDALIPTILEGLGVAELPDFIAKEYIADGRLINLLPDWSLPKGALYFVTPTARSRPAKIDALAEFLFARLSNPDWLG